MSLACTSAPCPGVAAQVELPGATHGLPGGPVQNCKGGLFLFLLQEFPGIPALLCPLLKGNSGQTPVPIPGLAHRV